MPLRNLLTAKPLCAGDQAMQAVVDGRWVSCFIRLMAQGFF
jgi:hypothetical protein